MIYYLGILKARCGLTDGYVPALAKVTNHPSEIRIFRVMFADVFRLTLGDRKTELRDDLVR